MGCVVDGRDGPSLAVTAVDLLLSRNARDLEAVEVGVIRFKFSRSR